MLKDNVYSFGWLASTCVRCYPSDVNFDIRTLGSGRIESYGVYNSTGGIGKAILGIRPIVRLNANVLMEFDNNEKMWILL